MKILLKLTSSKVDIEYMDTQPFIQGTDTRNKIYVYRDSSETPSLTDLSIAYQVQSGRTTLPLSNSGATTEVIDGTTYAKYTFNVPSTATAVAGNVVACLVTKTSTASFKTNIINRVLDSSEFDAFQSGLSGAAETYATAMESLSSANTIQDGRLTALEGAASSDATKIGNLNTTVYGNSDGTTASTGLTSKVSTLESKVGVLELDNATNKGDIVDLKAKDVELNAKDLDLQSQIDGINAGQNLADIVADLTALNSLSTTNLKSGDKVQVLVDSSHDNGSTVYNWNGASWVYVGKYGQDGYTKAETDTLLNAKADKTTVNSHIANTNNPHSVTKAQVGLGNVDNTSDLNKPVSTATQTALDLKANQSTTYTKTETDTLLATKQNKTIDAITVNGVDYTNIESAVDAINDFMAILNEEIGAIDGSGDTSLAERISELESEVTSLNTAWTEFTEETSADDIINTLVEIQNEFKKLDILTLTDISTSQTGTLTQTQANSITPRTTIILQTTVIDNGQTYTINRVYRVNYSYHDIFYAYEIISDLAHFGANELQIDTIGLTYDRTERYFENVITSSNKLSSDLVSDTNKSNKFVTPQEKTFITNEFNKKANVFNAYNLYDATVGTFSVIDTYSISVTSAGNINLVSIKYPITYVANDDSHQYKLHIKSSNTFTFGVKIGDSDVVYYAEYPISEYEKYALFKVPSGTTYISIIIANGGIGGLPSSNTFTLSEMMLCYPEYNSADTFVPKSKVEQMTDQDVENIDNALYNLGAFDSVSGNTITRKTKYFVLTGAESWTWSNSSGMWYATINGLVDGKNLVCSNGIVAVCYSDNQIRVYASSNPTITSSSNLNEIFNNGTRLEQELDIAYQYIESIIPNQPLLNLDSNGCNWLQNEWEKGLNLWNYQGSMSNTNEGVTATLNNSVLTLNGTNGGNGGWLLQNIPLNLKAGTYTIKYNGISSNLGFSINIYDSSDNLIQDVGYVDEKTFTISTNATHCSIWLTGNGRTYDNQTIQIMLNYGSHSYPYQEYNGEIVHKADIEPVLLWENSSPNSDFADQSVSLPSHSFKYYVCEFIQFKNEIKSRIFVKVNSNAFGVTVSCVVARSSTFLVREFGTFTGGMGFGDCYNSNNAVSNDSLIPYRIYGTNVL